MTKIEVFGTSCSKCKALMKNVEKAVQELSLNTEIVKVDSIQEIMERGVMMVPALYVNGQSMMIGRSGTVEEIKAFLKNGG